MFFSHRSSAANVPTLLTRSADRRWLYVESRFQGLLSDLQPTEPQCEDVRTKALEILACLNNHFWKGPVPSPYMTFMLAGSWAKGTRIRPSSDMDIIYFLPWAMWSRFDQRLGNRQSGILQEVRNALRQRYPLTDIKGDGPTVVVRFASYTIEIAPGFRDSLTEDMSDSDFKVWLCETNNGGQYRINAPVAERRQVLSLNETWNGDLISLISMAKCWKKHCNVPIKAFYIERMAIEFLSIWKHAGKGIFWYDWMMRDFFRFMISRQWGSGVLPQSNEPYFFGGEWVSRTETALRIADLACSYEERNVNSLAGETWQQTFGQSIPRMAL